MESHEKLKYLRYEIGKMSRKELARISGFKERTILAYETAESTAKSDYLEFCSLYFGYELESIKDNTKELKKMSEKEHTQKLFEITRNLNVLVDYNFAPGFYAQFVKNQITAKKLEKKEQYSKQDLELLAMFHLLSDDIKTSLKNLVNTILAMKGG